MGNKLPHIRTALPGPEARKVLALDRQYVSPSYTRDYPLVAQRGEGMIVEDVDGNTFLDFAAGIAVVSTGHCHPEVVRAIQRQAETLIHMPAADFYHPLLAQLAEKVAQITPGNFAKRIFFGNSGTFTANYTSATDRLTLGVGGNTTNIDGVVRGQWNADQVWVSFGGRGNGLNLASGNAYLDNFTATGDIIAAPEPATLALVAVGGLGALLRRRRK